MNTRSKIIESAARLFHEQGFAATGVATILRDAEVNSGSLYHFFPSKDALLESVLQWYQNHLYPHIMAPLESEQPDPLLRVLQLMDWYRGFLIDHQFRLGCPVGNLALEVSDSHPQMRQLLAGNFQQWADILASWLREDPEVLPAGTDPESLAVFILTVMEGGVMQARASGCIEPFDVSVAHMRRYLEMLSSKDLVPIHQEPAPVARKG